VFCNLYSDTKTAATLA